MNGEWRIANCEWQIEISGLTRQAGRPRINASEMTAAAEPPLPYTR